MCSLRTLREKLSLYSKKTTTFVCKLLILKSILTDILNELPLLNHPVSLFVFQTNGSFLNQLKTLDLT